MRMRCMICGDEHPYTNPKQFSSWAKRHRDKFHAAVTGRIQFNRVVSRAKRWKDITGDIGFSPRVMLKLPDLDNGTAIYFDRRTGIFWRHLIHYAQWSFYRPPLKHRRRSE